MPCLRFSAQKLEHQAAKANNMRDARKGTLPDSARVQSRKSTFKKSVDYFFDKPNVIRRPAKKTASNYVPVLATFDADNATILANEALVNAVERNRRTRHQLCDEDVETLTHEFARVLQYRQIFQDHLTQSDRIEALRKRRNQIVLDQRSKAIRIIGCIVNARLRKSYNE